MLIDKLVIYNNNRTINNTIINGYILTNINYSILTNIN